MDTKSLEKFAQSARRQLLEQVEARLDRVLQTDSAELRDQAKAVQQLQDEIHNSSREAVVDRVAYTWFNRFCAFRYMDANHYTNTGIVSPTPGFTQPQILQEAKQGYIDDEIAPYVDAQRVFDLLSGRIPSRDGQQEAYRLLLVGACNAYNTVMPFLFEEINDYTELLMPEDLLSPNSVLHDMREAMTEEACEDVEVIGWLYQFYISEKKDEVIGSKQKIQPEDIPAATQLFTPHWIVRYLVENSLGRLWLLNNPNSRLADQMPYYISEQSTVNSEQSSPSTVHRSPYTDYLKVTSPEELTVCDPAAGSGHMLTYAFDLLYAIYEEEGYNSPDIPRLILEKNLVGLEIDERAAALAAFALTMKAREKDRRFLDRGVRPQITALRPMTIDRQELEKADWFRELGKSLLELPVQDALLHDLEMMQQLDNIGSLLHPQLKPKQIAALRERITGGANLFSYGLNAQVLTALEQLEPLATKYHVVVANPPFMGKGMNVQLKEYLKSEYPIGKSDLFAAFVIRNLELAKSKGMLGNVTPFVWMYLSSYEKLRKLILSETTICNLVKPSYTSFFASAIVPLVAFVVKNFFEDSEGDYIDLGYLGSAESQPKKLKAAILDPNCGYFYRASAVDFQKIPGSPIAYWVSDTVYDLFAGSFELGKSYIPRVGMRTGDNERFLRFWHETSKHNSYTPSIDNQSHRDGYRWYPYNKGGQFRKWFGNLEYVVDWANDGYDIKEETLRNYPQLDWDNLGWKISNEQFYFQEAVTWTTISSSNFGARYVPPGFIFDSAGSCIFGPHLLQVLAFLGSVDI